MLDGTKMPTRYAASAVDPAPRRRNARMRRREFIAAIGGAAAAWPLAARAQQRRQKVLRVGLVSRSGSIFKWSHPIYAAFTKRMAELGYVEGRNIAFETVWVPSRKASDYDRGYRELVAHRLGER